MVLTAEERAELERLQAKEAEAPAEVPTLHLTLAADVADVIRQLVQVHWQSIAPEVGSAFQAAIAAAEAELAAAQAPAEPEPEPEPAEPEPPAAPAFGTESAPGSEPPL